MVFRNFLVPTGVVLSLLCAVLGGIDFSFTVYALQLKEIFNFSQSQVEITAATGTIGSSFIVLDLITVEVLGVGLTFISIWTVVTVSGVAFCLMVTFSELSGGYPVIIYMCHCTLIAGVSLGSIFIMRVMLTWFPRRHSGKLIGVFYAMFSLGKVFFATLMFFMRDDLAGFFFVVVAATTVLYGVTFWTLFKVLKIKSLELDCVDLKELLSLIPEETPCKIKEILRDWFFHLTFWPASISCGLTFANLQNITSIAAAAGVQYPMSMVYLIAVVIGVCRIICGMVFDRLRSSAFGLFLLLVGHVSLATSLILGMFDFNSTGLYAITALTGLSLATLLTITITILVHKFGRSRSNFFASTNAVVITAIETLALIFQGVTYDNEVHRLARYDQFCIGVGCYFNTFAAMLAVTLLMFCILSVKLAFVLYGELRQHSTTPK